MLVFAMSEYKKYKRIQKDLSEARVKWKKKHDKKFNKSNQS